MGNAHALNWRAGGALLALTAGFLLLPQVFAPFAAGAFLYVLPGYFLIKLLGVKLQPLEALAISLLASVMVSTYAIYWLSLAIGYSDGAFALFFAFVSLSALFVKGMPRLKWKKENALPLALALASALFIFAVLQLSLWVPSEGGIVTGGWNYADYFLHASIMQSVNSGNFPPQETVYAGEMLRYHWFADLHTAIGSKMLGIFPSFLSRVDSALGTGLFSLLACLLCFHFTKSWKVSLICAVLAVFGGGFGYSRLASEMGNAPLGELISNSPFDNDWGFFQIPSMLPGFLIPQRPMTIGLPALCAVLLLVAGGYPNDWRRLLLAGIILGMMPPFQYYAFLSAAILSALYFAAHYAPARSIRDFRNALLFVVLPSFLLAFPFLLDALGRAGGMTRLGLFWLAPHGNPLEFALFYAGNLGLAFALAFPGFMLFRGKGRMFLALGALLIFLLPNLLTFSNTQWDMSKFFMCEWALICVFASSFIARLPKWLIPLVIAFCCLSGILGSAFHVASGWKGLSNGEASAGDWIRANTPEMSVFSSSTSHNTPIDAVGGRLRILGYAGWVNNYGLEFKPRFEDLKALYCGPRNGAGEIMRKYGASYAYLGRSEANEYGCSPVFEGVPGFSLEYSSDGIRIYRFSG